MNCVICVLGEVKLGKLEKNKINFNKFILLYWEMKKKKIIYIYIYIYIYIVVFPVAKMKKKSAGKHGMGYCPFFFKFESQYNKLYCDRVGWLAAQGRAWTGQD